MQNSQQQIHNEHHHNNKLDKNHHIKKDKKRPLKRNPTNRLTSLKKYNTNATTNHQKASQLLFIHKPDEWLQFASKWNTFKSVTVSQCISKQMLQLPIFSSIQQLFSLKSNIKLTQSSNFSDLNRYYQIVSCIDDNKYQTLELRHEEITALCILQTERQKLNQAKNLILLSPLQVQMIQKRSIFMEKLIENENKYDKNLSRMTQLSKQLAFTYRIYIQNRNELKNIFSSVSQKISFQNSAQLQSSTQYMKFLIQKNLKKLCTNQSIDLLNYFKEKEHKEFNKSNQFSPILSFQEFRNFIDKRKPKRGRRLSLATSCSVCLSNCHQLYNPLEDCGVCGLRAHKLCYPFSKKKCGNCAYQRLKKNLKQEIGCCFICHQSGLMIVKLSNKLFAHAFCLLVHGYWNLRFKREIHDFDDNQVHDDEQKDYCSNQMSGNIASLQIEYYNPLKNNSISYNTIKEFKQQAIEYKQYESKMINHQLQLMSCGDKPIFCRLCQKAIFKHCHVDCNKCKSQYHAMCAYLSGYQFFNDQKPRQQSMNRALCFSVVCCNKNNRQNEWNRKFKLNYQRIVFQLNEKNYKQKYSLICEQL